MSLTRRGAILAHAEQQRQCRFAADELRRNKKASADLRSPFHCFKPGDVVTHLGIETFAVVVCFPVALCSSAVSRAAIALNSCFSASFSCCQAPYRACRWSINVC